MGYFDKFSSKGIPFMDGRDKADLGTVLDETVHIVDFGFIRGNDGEYGVMALAEHEDCFYFANGVITDMLREVQKDGMENALKDQPVKFVKAKSKKTGRDYYRYEFL